MTTNLLTILDRQDRSCLGTDPEVFVSDNLGDQNYAKLVCDKCPVLAACLNYAMERPSMVGVWGGTSYQDRSRMRRHG
jgi:WhiB family redox-sensing transcriptional regulator